MVRRVIVTGEVKLFSNGAEGKPSVNSAMNWSAALDPKPGDLAMSRVKWRYSSMEARTHVRCNDRRGLVASGEIPIEPGDSWFSPK